MGELLAMVNEICALAQLEFSALAGAHGMRPITANWGSHAPWPGSVNAGAVLFDPPVRL
jgi:hypothetical protein